MAATPIYLDYNATTPLDPRVLDGMMPYLCDRFGNASSAQHAFGRDAGAAVDRARQQVGALIDATPKTIVFTSGATESDNLAIRGVALAYAEKGRHIVTAVHEHLAVVDPCRRLEREGYEITWLRPGPDGVIKAAQVAEAIRDDTILVSVMWSNNELGSINEVPAIGRVCRERGVLFHTDATQWVAKQPTDVDAANIDLLSATAHKFYGPKGVGFLYVCDRGPRVRLQPLVEGGGQESGLRSGTLNVPGIVGLGAAADVALNEMDHEAKRLAALRDRLEKAILGAVDQVKVNSPPHARMPAVWHASFVGVDHRKLMEAMPDVAVSAAAACHSGDARPSYVLKAIGLSDELALCSLRFSLGRFTTDHEVDTVARQVIDAVTQLRSGR